MLKRPLILLLGLGVLLLLVWGRIPSRPHEVARTALLMGTLVEIKVIGGDDKKIEDAISDAFSVMRQVEQVYTTEDEDSLISQLNRTSESLDIPPAVAGLLRLGLDVQRKSDGAFSMGLGEVKRLWAIESDNPQLPSGQELARALPNSSLATVQLDGSRVRRSSARVQLDLGGIAKGYAVDRALESLAAAGVASASVNAGGDIGLIGMHGDRAWRIGIQHPRKSGELLATVELSGQAIVTSGDYERYFVKDGVRYHHIFDPRTGLPSRACQSVSILAPQAALADALATAVFVLGPVQGMKLLDKYPGAEGLIVAADGEVHVSDGLKDRLTWH